jgi:hypothetical protein
MIVPVRKFVVMELANTEALISNFGQAMAHSRMMKLVLRARKIAGLVLLVAMEFVNLPQFS